VLVQPPSPDCSFRPLIVRRASAELRRQTNGGGILWDLMSVDGRESRAVEERHLRDAVLQRPPPGRRLPVDREDADLAAARAAGLPREAACASPLMKRCQPRATARAPVLLDEVEGRLGPSEEGVDGELVREDADFREDSADVGLTDRGRLRRSESVPVACSAA